MAIKTKPVTLKCPYAPLFFYLREEEEEKRRKKKNCTA
jgi:hypothetical protein